MGPGRFFQALQQVQAVAQIRQARRSHPSLQNLGQDPLALRVVSLLRDDVSVLPSPSDFETLLVALTQRAGEFEKESMLRGLTLWKTWAHASTEGEDRAAHRWTRVDVAQHCIENTVRQGETFSNPMHIIDDEMDVWNELWQRHGKISAPVPDGVVWDSLAVPSCDDIGGLLGHMTSFCAWC